MHLSWKSVCDEVRTNGEPNESWLYRLPLQLACFLLAVCLVSSQINPCDATSVAMGSSVTFILLAIGIGFFVAIDAVLVPQEAEPDMLRNWFFVSWTVFGVWIWGCTLLVPGRGNARFAYNGCWQWIAQGILILSITRLSFRTTIGNRLIALMLACAAGTVAYAGYQYFVGMPAFRRSFSNDPNSILEKMDVIPGSSAAIQFVNRLQSLEPTGPFALTNSLAGLMAVWLVYLVVLFVSYSSTAVASPIAKRIRWTNLTLGIGLFVGLSVTLLLTKSRSAWLATLIGLVASCFFLPTIRQSGWAIAWRFRIALSVVVVSCSLALGAVLVRDPFIVLEAGKSLSYRFDYWQGAYSLIQSKPWTGYGVANFQQSYNQVKMITASESPADPHNFLFETAVAGGYPLLLILACIVVILFLKLLAASFQTRQEGVRPFGTTVGCKDEGRLALSLGGLGCLAGILLFCLLFGDGDSLYAGSLFALVSLGVFAGIERLRWIDQDSQSHSIELISAAIFLLHLLASGGWMQPGLMNSFCVLVGVALGARVGKRNAIDPSGERRILIAPWLGLFFVIISMAGFAKTTWFPVLGSAAFMNAVSFDTVRLRSPEDLIEIMAVDPYDPELARMAANRCFVELRRSDLSLAMREKYLTLLDECCGEYISRDPNQWMPYAQCGQWLAILVDSESRLELSIDAQMRDRVRVYEMFSRAAELYPNSIQTQLQAGVAAAWCGKYPEAQSHCEKVEEIDRETPHLDRRLASVFVFFPTDLDTMESPLGQDSWIEKRDRSARGEPVLKWLRTNVP